MQATFEVPDVSCAHCKGAIEGALRPVRGVREAEVDVAAKQVSVEFDAETVDRGELVRVIEAAGYSVTKF